MSISPKLEYDDNPWSKETEVYNDSEHSEDDSSDSANGSKRRRNFVRREDAKRSKALTSEGFCMEHEIPQHLRCMTCEKWICGVCSTLHHKSCRTLLVSEAMKELEIDSMKNAKITAEWLSEKVTCIQKLNDSYDQKKQDLLESVKYHQDQYEQDLQKLDDIEPILQSITGLRDQLTDYEMKKDAHSICREEESRIKESVDADVKIVEGELAKFDKNCKNGQIPRGLHNKMNKYEIICHISATDMYAVKTDGSQNLYARLSVKDKMIKIHSFQKVTPPGEPRLIEYNECLEALTGGIKTPKITFIEISMNDRKLGDLICKVFSRGSREEEAFIILCLGTGNVSFKGITLWLGGTAYVYAPNLTVKTDSIEQSTERRHPEMGDIQAISSVTSGGTEMGVNFWTRMNNKKYTNAGYLGKIRSGMECLQAGVQEMLSNDSTTSSASKPISAPGPGILGSYHNPTNITRPGFDIKSEAIRPNQNGGLRGHEHNPPPRGYGPTSVYNDMRRFDHHRLGQGPRPPMMAPGYPLNNHSSQQTPIRVPPSHLRGAGNGAMRGGASNIGPRGAGGFRTYVPPQHQSQRPIMTPPGANLRPLMSLPPTRPGINPRFSQAPGPSGVGTRPVGPGVGNSTVNGSKSSQNNKKIKVTDCGLVIDVDFI